MLCLCLNVDGLVKVFIFFVNLVRVRWCDFLDCITALLYVQPATTCVGDAAYSHSDDCGGMN